MKPRTALHARLSALGNVHARNERSAVDHAAARARRPLDRAFLRHVTKIDQLAQLGASVDERVSGTTPDGPRVLVASLRGWPDHVAYESVIAQALRLRGADVTLLTCGGGMPICEVGWRRVAAPRPCDRCGWLTDRARAAAAMRSVRLADELPWGGDGAQAPADAGAVAHPGPDPGAQAAISLPWFLRTTDLGMPPEAPAAAADFAVAVAGVQAVAQRLLDRHEPEIVFALNGLFAAERALRSVALARGLRVPTYEISPRSGALAFAQHVPAPDYDTDDAWARVADTPLTAEQERAITDLLADRARGVGAHERYFDGTGAASVRAQLDLPADRRIVSLFTNLTWDSATLEKDVGYRSMIDWIEHAVGVAGTLDDAVLVVRVHPAEISWGSREFVGETVTQRLGTLPANVRIVGPDVALSSYAIVDESSLVLAYATTVGLEAAASGIPVAVAARTHYRGRGFTHDVETPEDLERVLRDPPPPLTAHERDLALRYAYTWLFRCMVPFPAVKIRGGNVQGVPTTADAIAPGADPYVDFVCDRLLDGAAFTLPDELAGRPVTLLSRA